LARAGAKLLELKTEFVTHFPWRNPRAALSKNVFIRSSIHSPPEAVMVAPQDIAVPEPGVDIDDPSVFRPAL
jgi:hypothetical protein